MPVAGVDALFSSNLTIGGLFSAEGFGTHTFSGSGTGANTLQVRNTSAGTGNYAGVTIGTDASSSQMRVYALSSTYSSTAFYVASGAAIECAGSGGLTIGASNAAGEIRFFANDTTNYRAKIVAGGHLVLNELTTNPGTSDCAADAAVAIYTKADKFVIAYNNGGTMTYITLDLDGSDTTWAHSTSAP